MGVASGCGEQEVGVASGSGWNLWVWLLGVVLRRYMPSTARGVLSNLLKSLAKIAIGCSQTIFNARHSPSWSTSKLFYVI